MGGAEAIYLLVGATVLVLALASHMLKARLWSSEPLVALGIGALVGPVGFGWVDVQLRGTDVATLEMVARLTVAISIMGVALRLPDRYLRHGWKPVTVMLLAGMPLMWLVSSGLAAGLLGLPLLMALLMGAVVTPTDPVLADTIVTGRLAEHNIHGRVRHLISTEAGANDGLAFLLVMLPVLLMEHAAGEAMSRWLTKVLLREVVLAILVGAVAGTLTGWLVRWGLREDRMAGTPLLAVSVALAIALLGGVRMIHADGLLAVFAAGIALNWVVRGSQDQRQEEVQEAITRFFDQPVFVLFGLALPVGAWMEVGWPLVAFAGAVLVLRRLPIVLALKPLLKPLQRWREALFVGWFGPIGAAALVYATWADVHEGTEQIWVVGSFVVTASVLLHGITATPFTQLYARMAAEEEEVHGQAIGKEALGDRRGVHPGVQHRARARDDEPRDGLPAEHGRK